MRQSIEFSAWFQSQLTCARVERTQITETDQFSEIDTSPPMGISPFHLSPPIAYSACKFVFHCVSLVLKRIFKRIFRTFHLCGRSNRCTVQKGFELTEFEIRLTLHPKLWFLGLYKFSSYSSIMYFQREIPLSSFIRPLLIIIFFPSNVQ